MKKGLGKLAWFPMAGRIVEILDIRFPVVTFMLFTENGIRINKTFIHCLEVLE